MEIVEFNLVVVELRKHHIVFSSCDSADVVRHLEGTIERTLPREYYCICSFYEVDDSNHVNSVEKFLPLPEHEPLKLCTYLRATHFVLNVKEDTFIYIIIHTQ